MAVGRERLRMLIDKVHRAGGALSLDDGRAVVTGALDSRLLLRVHRHRRDLTRLLR